MLLIAFDVSLPEYIMYSFLLVELSFEEEDPTFGGY